MFELVIFIVIALCIFGFVTWIFLCLNSGRISEEEREKNFEIACKRAREILKRRKYDDER